MEDITLGQISLAVVFIVGLISGIAYIKKHFQAWIKNSLKTDFEKLGNQVTALSERVSTVDMEDTKNFLVRYLSDVERGVEMDEIEKIRFAEQYDHYLKMDGNSYIRAKVKKLQEAGKL